MASQAPPTTPADEHDATPRPLSVHRPRPQRRLWPRSRTRFCLPRPCFRPKKVLIHSSWITLVGLFFIRLANADTSGATEVRVFAIAGAAGSSLPWLLIFLATAAITVFLEAGICDLTWIFSGSGGAPPQRKHREDRSAEDDGGDADAPDAAAAPRGGGGADDGAEKDGSGLPSAVDEASTSSAAPAAAEEASPP